MQREQSTLGELKNMLARLDCRKIQEVDLPDHTVVNIDTHFEVADGEPVFGLVAVMEC